MRKFLSVFLAAAVTVLLAFTLVAQDAAKAKGKGPPKNLKILTPENFRPMMDVFVTGLGLSDKGGCNYCHVADRSSDENPKKNVARMMITMVGDINGKFPDGKMHVTCFTCHRGDPMPKTEP
jgi:photosynthetic reaction center cytochrome c subunit